MSFGVIQQPAYNRVMGRVIHVRLHGLDPDRRDPVRARFAELAASRQWRHQTPWLADAGSCEIFAQLYFADQRAASIFADPGAGPLSAATFIRIGADETDALAALFIVRDLSESFDLRAVLADPDNPIAKLRLVDMHYGRLPDGSALESRLVRRPIFKRLNQESRIEFFPPGALGSAFGTPDGEDLQRRGWSFHVAGMRGSAPDFFEAEAEAMRIHRGLGRLGLAG